MSCCARSPYFLNHAWRSFLKVHGGKCGREILNATRLYTFDEWQARADELIMTADMFQCKVCKDATLHDEYLLPAPYLGDISARFRQETVGTHAWASTWHFNATPVYDASFHAWIGANSSRNW